MVVVYGEKVIVRTEKKARENVERKNKKIRGKEGTSKKTLDKFYIAICNKRAKTNFFRGGRALVSPDKAPENVKNWHAAPKKNRKRRVARTG